jgi:hypothetical protein
MTLSFLRTPRYLIGGALLLGVLGLLGSVVAQQEGTPQAGKAPFANAVDQREEMIRELRDIRTLMKEQNALLKQLVDHAQGTSKPKR